MAGRALIAWTSAVALALGACDRNPSPSGRDGGSPDASADAGDPAVECSVERQDCDAGQSCSWYAREDGALGARCFDGACRLVAQDCGAGRKCTFVEDGGAAVRACVDDGDAGEGEPCSPTVVSNTCRAGTVCMPVRYLDGGAQNLCVRYCEKDADCGAGAACFLVLELEGTKERPLTCARPCDLFQQDCPPGEACYPGPSVPGCYPEGDGAAGAACVGSDECLPGAACVGKKCAFLCAYPSGPPACATGTCSPLNYPGAPDAGACL